MLVMNNVSDEQCEWWTMRMINNIRMMNNVNDEKWNVNDEQLNVNNEQCEWWFYVSAYKLYSGLLSPIKA